jgi:hypothetical protein
MWIIIATPKLITPIEVAIDRIQMRPTVRKVKRVRNTRWNKDPLKRCLMKGKQPPA